MRPKFTKSKVNFAAASILVFAFFYGCGGLEKTPGAEPEIESSENAVSPDRNPLADTE